jgi:hypothetical protein
MTIEKILDELKKHEDVFKLAVLYLKMTNSGKSELLNLYEKGISKGEENVVQAILAAIKDDKKVFESMKEIIKMDAIGNMETPTYTEATDTIKKHTAPIDPDIAKKVFKK